MLDVSVVITTHNLEKYIRICLDELSMQTFKNFEVIIVDDCSDDRTVKFCKEYKDKFPNGFEIIETSNNFKLPGRVRNVAINSELLHGKYVVFLDGDDHIEKDYLEKMYQTINEKNADMVICAYDRVDIESGKIICTEMNRNYGTINLQQSTDIIAFCNGASWNKIYRTEIVREQNFPPIKCGEDIIFQFLMYFKCKKIVFINDILIHYQVRVKSIMSSIDMDEAISFANYFLEIYKKADNRFKNVTELAIFIHIGISMPMRICNNSKIEIKEYLKWVYNYFNDNFNWFLENKLMSIKSLMKKGIRGIAIYICLVLYKKRAISIFIKFYSNISKVLNKDIKF
ncbi:MAG: family 2 glycosyl transferase [Clostridiaceae bacterium]|jgi:glycosyltransferase involved in cell wall biosynthesis|nr:family 2 glycosyl transferase [Clostridiaceae bacterium]